MRANLIIGIFIVIVIGLGYWAFGSITEKNTSLIEGAKTVDVGPVMTSDPGVPIATYESPTTETMASDTSMPTPEPVDTPSLVSSGKNSVLIGNLQGLIDDNVLMKKGSRGTRVGTVQEFLKLYGMKISVDNDYGDTTVTAVKKFQGEQKLSADGQTGEGTYKKMIEWLEKN